MDRKTLLIIALSLALLLAWFPLTNKLFPPIILPPRPTNTVTTFAAASNGTQNLDNPAFKQLGQAKSAGATEVKEETLAVESDDARYVFTSRGGGLKTIALKKYPETVGLKAVDTNKWATLNAKAPVPAMTLIGPESVTGDGVYKLFKLDNNLGVRAEKTLPSGLKAVKEYRFSTNYLLKVSLRLENSGGDAITVPAREVVIGTSTPMSVRNENMNLGFEWYNGTSAERIVESWFLNKTFIFFGGEPRTTYTGGSSNVQWAAVHNQFFTMIGVPVVPAQSVVGRRVDLAVPTASEIADYPKAFTAPYGYQTSLAYPEVTIPPSQAFKQDFDLFAGPKEYNTLSRLGREVDLVMGFDGFIGFFAKSLLLSLNGLHALGLAYGLAIVGITVCIKLIFWPLTTASTRSMKRMQTLQPQMKAIQEKYKSEPAKAQAKLGEFMKEHKINPVAGCLPMLVQIPVFFGFYRMLQSAIELRGAPFLWAHDLSQPDTIAMIAGFPINPFPLLMGATMIWQANITPPSPGVDPAQQRIMKYMPLMMMVFLYNFSTGLTIYWTAQNLLSILQMKITRTPPPETAALPAATRKKS